MKIEVGKDYRTYGGWKAKVIWRWTSGDMNFLVVHKPGIYNNIDERERLGYCHPDGISYLSFGIDEPPRYGKHHPADLMEEWSEKPILIYAGGETVYDMVLSKGGNVLKSIDYHVVHEDDYSCVLEDISKGCTKRVEINKSVFRMTEDEKNFYFQKIEGEKKEDK